MTLETIYYISEIATALAVLASLVFIGIQIRQNTEQTKDTNRLARAQMHQQIADGFTDAMSLSMQLEDDVVEKLFLKGNADLATEAELQRFSIMMLGLWKHLENSFYQHKEGFVADAYWESTKNYVRLLLSRPGSRKWWEKRKSVFAIEFTNFVDSLGNVADFEEIR